jgi:uncharacterized repeat protein (TIGR02543 family)
MLVLAALAISAGSASGRSAATTTITVGIAGTGAVTSSPSGISCPGTCTSGFTGTSAIVLSPSNTASGWTFDHWTCSGTDEAAVGNTCQITPGASDSNHNVTATFVFTPPPPPTPTGVTGVSVIGKGQVTSPNKGINCGDGKKTCALNLGGAATLTATETENGWTFDHWNDWDLTDGAPGPCDLDTADTCDVSGDGHDHEITATFAGPPTNSRTLSTTFSGSGTLTGGNNQIDCGSAGTTCSWSVPAGSVLTVVETPDPGAVFSGWGGACGGTGISCTTEMSGDRSVNATWSASTDTAQLSVSITGSGQVSGAGINCPSTCVSTQALNSSVTLTASPDDGYVFSTWGGACGASTSPTCTVTMTGAASVTAAFTQANLLSVTINGNGSVTGGSGAINCGGGATICSAGFLPTASVSLVASPATGATFLGWSGACGGTATTCTVLMNQAKGVTANFSGGTTGGFNLSVSVVGNGTVTGGGISCGAGATTCSSPNHAAGSTATLNATPSSGATFTGWSGACAGTSPTCTVTFDAAKTVVATFSGGAAGTFPLNVSVSGPGRVTGALVNCGNGGSACNATFNSGTTVTLTATPAAGATFDGWGGACTGTTPKCTVSMTAARSVTATFTASGSPGTLTITVVGRGAVSTAAGACASTARKTCVQRFKAGATAVLTARPGARQLFLGWAGACSGKATTCRVKLSTALAATATFTNRAPTKATLSSLGPPIVRKTSSGYRVTLRFLTTAGGTARVRAVRAGRPVTTVSARVAAGRVRVGPFPVPLAGFYTFEVRLAGDLLRTRACLGSCGAAAPPPPFQLVREAPTVTRAGDVWSVTLHVTANQIYDGRIRASRAGRLLVNQHFLGRAGQVAFGPFLLGPGNYTLRLVALDAYGRVRTLTWIVSLR